MYVVPPSVRDSPATAATSFGLSTPFWTVSTVVSLLEHRRQQRQRRLVVVRFDRDDHELDRSDLRRVLLGAAVRDEVAEFAAPDLQAVLADRRQVGAARDERDVMAGTRELRAVIAAHGS